MTCNCDNDGSNEYIIELNQQGAPGVKGEQGEQGYSPIVDYTSDNNALQFHIVNEQNTVTTPEIPLKSYTDTQLAGKLNKDGSNADNPININGLKIEQSQRSKPVYLSSNTTGGVCITNNTNTYLTLATNELSYRNAVNDVIFELFGQYTAGTNQLASNKDFYFNNWNNSKFYYGYSGNYNEIATVDQIPTVGNGTITITQDGVTKGTFTTNQSGNTTINLDSGVTNPLDIKNSNNTRSISLGINSDNQAYMYYNIRTEGGGFSVPVGLLYLSSNTIDFTERSADGLYTIEAKEMVGCDSITGGASGLVPAPSAGDQDKFLKGDGTWDTVGGGGSSYTAGTGINITNDTISVKDVQSFTRITIANGYSAGIGLWGKLLDGSSSIPLVRVSGLDDVIIGDDGSKLVLHGDETRPSYFDSHTTSYLALYSDIPDVSDFVTSSSLSTTLADYVLSSSLATVATTGSYADLLNKPTIPTNSDYVDLSSNQSVAGNKTLTGTTYLRTTYICNASGTYFGRTRAVDDKFTFEAIGTNRSINLIPNGTGTLQYNGTEVATVNDIPDISELEEKFTVGNGLEMLQAGTEIPSAVVIPYTISSSYTGIEFYNNLTSGETKTAVIKLPSTGNYVQYYIGNASRRGIMVNPVDDSIWLGDGQSGNLNNSYSFTKGTDNYLKIVSYNGGATDVFYSHDNLTWTLLMPQDRAGQTMGFGAEVGIYTESIDSITFDYFKLYYGAILENTLQVDTTVIATKSYVDSVAGTGYSSSLIIS